MEWPRIHPKDEVLVCVKKITMACTDPLPIPHSVYNTTNNIIIVIILYHWVSCRGSFYSINFLDKNCHLKLIPEDDLVFCWRVEGFLHTLT